MKSQFSKFFVALSLSVAATQGNAQVYTFSTLAGVGGFNGVGTNNGAGTGAKFDQPYGVAVDSSNYVYVADLANNEIRKITPGGVVSVLAGAGIFGLGTNNGTGVNAKFSNPAGVAVDKAGNVYVADSGNNSIRKITPGGVVTTFAGDSGSSGLGTGGTNDGVGSAARFAGPTGVAVDSSNYLYVADSQNNTIRKITPAGDVTTLAGQPQVSGTADGLGEAAQFFNPRGVAVDGTGNVYVADTGNSRIRKITPGGQVSTLAGWIRNAFADGTGTNAGFGGPFGLGVDSSGNVYVADSENYTIRKITPSGVVTTLANTNKQGGLSNGVGSVAEFSFPTSVAVSSSGVLYIADEQNNVIRQGTPPGLTNPPVLVSASASPAADGTVTGGGSFEPGTSVTVTAVPATGFAFISWTLNGTVVSTTAAYTFPASAEALVANFAKAPPSVKITTSASPAAGGTTAGGGSFPSGTSVTLTATVTNDCYEFVAWTLSGAKVSSNASYTFTTSVKNEALVATFALQQYAINASVSPLKSGTVSGEGNKSCGTTVTLTAHANTGFGFVNWTTTPGGSNIVSTSATYKFTASGSESLIANFRDNKAPTIKITSPTANESVASAAFAIQGTTTDNSGVASVYYSLNNGPWTQATLTGGSAWYAWVTLKPNGVNTVSAYATDLSGNTNTPVTTKFTCSAAGFAPMSIAGQLAGLTQGTNTENSSVVSFDLAGYVLLSPDNTQGGKVGTYTYTPTGSNTAELVPNQVFPTQNNGTNNTVLELTFTNAYGATYSDKNNPTNTGALNFVLAEDTTPETLDGSSVISTSFANTNSSYTNIFGASTFSSAGGIGGNSSGTYTFTKFTAVAGLIVQTVTNSTVGTASTNYFVVWFNEGSSNTGYYAFTSVDGTQYSPTDTGSFVLAPGTDNTKFVGPVTLSGLEATVTPKGEPAFVRTYGNGTFASLALKTLAEPSDVGIYLANTRASANTGTDQFIPVAPPTVVTADDETLDLVFSTGTKYSYTVPGSALSGAAVLSKITTLVPPAVSGSTITFTPTGGGKSSIVGFNYNQFVTKNESGTGTYTYAPYTPTMAYFSVTFTGGSVAGDIEYVITQFTSTTHGAYGVARLASGTWEYEAGTFSLAK